MVTMSTIILAVVFVAVIYYFCRNKLNLPPGPRGFPFLGSLFSLSMSPHLTFREWAKKYGPIVYAKLGTTPVVILDDLKVIKEAFSNPVFSGKPRLAIFELMSEGKYGILNTDGQTWSDQRRYTLRNLRDFGFGKSSMESTIHDEVLDLIDWMKRNENKAVSVNKKFNLTVLNALWLTIAGHRYEQDDTKATTLINSANEAFHAELTKRGWMIFFPELTKVAMRFPEFSGWNKLVEITKPFEQIFTGVITEHEENPSDEANPRDFVDVYLNEISKTTDPHSSFYKENGRKSLVTLLGDLYFAGSGTTSTALAFVILFIMRHPKVQSKLQKEIDSVIGLTRQPSLSDRPNTPYCEATLLECLRFSSQTPTGLFHRAMEDIKFHGYDIKKDTMVIANFYSVHFNPEIWGDPENFRPERFLSKDEKTVVRPEALMVFSTGKRQCLGESMARDQLYLFVTSIFQRFSALEDPANPNPSIEPKPGMFREPQDYTVVFKDRQ